jgi:hypothetical protein
MLQDHSYAHPTDAFTLMKKLMVAEKRIIKLQKDLRCAKLREKRAKKVMKSAVLELKSKNLLSLELQAKLKAYASKEIKFLKILLLSNNKA